MKTLELGNLLIRVNRVYSVPKSSDEAKSVLGGKAGTVLNSHFVLCIQIMLFKRNQTEPHKKYMSSLMTVVTDSH